MGCEEEYSCSLELLETKGWVGEVCDPNPVIENGFPECIYMLLYGNLQVRFFSVNTQIRKF